MVYIDSGSNLLSNKEESGPEYLKINLLWFTISLLRWKLLNRLGLGAEIWKRSDVWCPFGCAGTRAWTWWPRFAINRQMECHWTMAAALQAMKGTRCRGIPDSSRAVELNCLILWGMPPDYQLRSQFQYLGIPQQGRVLISLRPNRTCRRIDVANHGTCCGRLRQTP